MALQRINWLQIDTENVPSGSVIDVGSITGPLHAGYFENLYISGQTIDDLKRPEEFIFRKIDKIQVVGKSEPVQTYEIITLNVDPDPNILQLRDIFSKGIECYENKNWDEAIQHFKQSLELEKYRFSDLIKTKTNPSEVYIERCEEFKNNPPPKDWDGVYVLTKK